MNDTTVKYLSALHTALFRVTGGRIGHRLVHNEMCLLTTTGARSGRPHTVPLLYLEDGERLVVIASYGGRVHHPDWYHNLVQNPEATVQIFSRRRRVTSRTADTAERAEWWPRIVAAYPDYDAYQSRTEREIPVVFLDPRNSKTPRYRPTRMLKRLMIGVTLVFTACGATDVASAVPGDEVVIVIESTGGCAQMGPNCTRLVISGDGTVEAYRFVIDGGELVAIGSIDPELVAELHALVATTDLGALRARLPAGHCRGCFDGIDTTMTFYGGARPEVFGSVEVELDPSEPVFAAAWAVAAAADEAVQIPLVTR